MKNGGFWAIKKIKDLIFYFIRKEEFFMVSVEDEKMSEKNILFKVIISMRSSGLYVGKDYVFNNLLSLL